MNPVALGMVSAASGVIALVPGMPILPFRGDRRWAPGRWPGAARRPPTAPKVEPPKPPPRPRRSRSPRAWPSTTSRSSSATASCSLINDLDGRRLTDQIRALRRTLAAEFGFVMPPVRILDNMRLPNQGYAIRIKEMEIGAGEVRLGMLMAMDPRGGQVELPGEHVREPAFGLPATWIDESLREEATFRGYTIVDPATVLTTHLTEILKENMPDLLSYAEVQKLLKDLPAEEKKLVEDLIPARRHRQHHPARAAGAAARAGVDPRPAGDPGGHRRGRRRTPSSIISLVEQVRARLGPAALLLQPRRRRLAADRHPVARLGGRLRRRPDRPGRRQAAGDGALAACRSSSAACARPSSAPRCSRRKPGAADQPAGPPLRPLDRRALPGQTVVMSQNEIHPRARLKTIASI